MDRHDSKKTRNSVMGRLKQNQQSDNDSDQSCKIKTPTEIT